MTPFLRFTLLLIAAAAVINLSIIVVGNHFGERRQQEAVAKEKQRIADKFTVPEDRRNLPVAHVVVRSQERSGDFVPLHTTILVREYRFNGRVIKSFERDEGKREALPVRQIVIQGNQLRAGGLYFTFNKVFPKYEFLAGKAGWMLNEMYSDQFSDDKSRFKFYTSHAVPEIFLEDGKNPSQFDLNLWYYIGDIYDAQIREQKTEVQRLAGAEVFRFTSEPVTLNLNDVYTVQISPTGIKLLQITASQQLADDIANEAKAAATRPALPKP